MRKYLVALTILFSCLNTVFALDGSGSEAAPWLIKNITDFDEFVGNSDYWDDFTRLDVNIDLTGRTYLNSVIAPYGSLDFAGTFDGNGHEVQNLAIDDPGVGNGYLGLFGRTDSSAVIKNLAITNGLVNGSTHIGSLVGQNYGSIQSCATDGNVTSDIASYGIGGLVGDNYGSIELCCADVNVNSGDGSYGLGVLVGYNDGDISNCSAAGSVLAGNNAGGFGGLTGDNEGGNIENCYATGTVTAGNNARFIGSLLGYNYLGTITNCYALGPAIAGDNPLYLSSFVGYSYNSSYTACFWDIQTSGIADNGVGNVDPDPTGVSGKTTTQMKTETTFTDALWDFVAVWDICEGVTYPLFTWQDSPAATVTARHIFYNRSYFDGNNPTANANDDNAIATDKTALLPGETATFANYTSYSRGINGIIIDVACLPGTPATGDDIIFYVGNNSTPAGWILAPDPSSITIRPGEGAGGSDRITIIWPDNAIQKKWLQVTVMATDETGLAEDDIFYFGNALGDTGNKPTDANVNVLDVSGIRDNPRNIFNPAPIDNPHDINRDHNVNVLDVSFVRDNATNIFTALKLINP